MINDPYTKLNQILVNNTAITSLLGFYQGTSIPLIKGGILAETETALPAITFYANSHDSYVNNNDSLFTINCYAKEERDSFLLAKIVVDELKGLQDCEDGYAVTCTPRIITGIPDPVAKEVNTAVEVRLFNIGGAL